MIEPIFSELLKLGVVSALLGYIAITLWKRVDARAKANELEIKDLQNRFQNEILNDRTELKLLIKENTDLARSTTAVLARNSSVMECLTAEIKKIKPEFGQRMKEAS